MLLVLEFNELCPSLLQRFMRQGLLHSLFASSTNRPRSGHTTDAEEGPPQLEPWIQWPTVHSGRPYSEPRVFHLGDGRHLEHKCIAELLSDAGIPVGICASMNLNYRPAPRLRPGRRSLGQGWRGFFPTGSSRFRASSPGRCRNRRAQNRFPSRTFWHFGTFLLGNGLTFDTVRMLVSQLWSERSDPGLCWLAAARLPP